MSEPETNVDVYAVFRQHGTRTAMTALQLKQILRVPQYVHTRLWRDIFALLCSS